jgi:preprotein translocase subunit SecG
MEIVVLSIHLLVCICLIGLVLLQRSEGGALGMGGGGGGSLMSGRGAADALARMTSVAGAFFLATSLGLTFLSGAAASDNGRSVLDAAPIERPATTPAPVPAEPARPDPTESSLPAETQLASIGPPDAAAAPTQVAPAPSAATTRAGPIERSTPTSSAPPQRSTAAATPRTQPAASQPTSTQSSTQRPATTIRSTGATTPATIPGQRTGAVDGVNLNEPAQPESVDVGNGLEAVRRERAGPDQ